MSNELVPFALDALPCETEEALAALDDVAVQPKYLPRLVLTAFTSDLVKDQKCKAGLWVVPKGKDCTVIGSSIDVIPIAVRDKAVDMSVKPAISNYDKDSDEYARIKKMTKNAYCGRSFLVLERTTSQLFELYFGNKSGQLESDKMKPFLGREGPEGHPPRTATVRAKLVEGENSYYVPEIVRCSEPITGGPDMGTIHEERRKFKNPTDGQAQVEKAKDKGRAH